MSRFSQLAKQYTKEEWTNLHNGTARHEGKKIYSASDIPCVLRVGYTSVQKLYRISHGIEKRENLDNLPHIKYGNDHEPIAIKEFHEVTHNLYTPIKTGPVIHPLYSNNWAT